MPYARVHRVFRKTSVIVSSGLSIAFLGGKHAGPFLNGKLAVWGGKVGQSSRDNAQK